MNTGFYPRGLSDPLGWESSLQSLGVVSSVGPMEQLQQYVPVAILAVLALLFAFGTLVASVILGKAGKATQTKDSAYECGMNAIGEGSARLSVKFYLVAMLFILFDIEVVFMFPWAVVFRSMLANPATTNLIFFSMVSFMAILVVGYVYALKKRAFDWKS